MPDWLEQAKKWVYQAIEIAIALIALAVVLSVLIGPSLPFFGNIVDNLMGIIDSLGQNGLVGLIALGILLYLYTRRNRGA